MAPVSADEMSAATCRRVRQTCMTSHPKHVVRIDRRKGKSMGKTASKTFASIEGSDRRGFRVDMRIECDIEGQRAETCENRSAPSAST